MRVFVAGASGAIGTRLVRQLTERGHEVIGTYRKPGHGDTISLEGALAIKLDLLDREAVAAAMLDHEPDAVVHEATALDGVKFSRSLDRTFVQTNRLRIEATDTLWAAAREPRVNWFVAQSFASLRYARVGGPVKSEDDPLEPSPPQAARKTQAAMRHVDDAGPAAGGIALRYGLFYGAPTDGLPGPVRK